MVQVKNKVCLIVHDGWGIAATPGLEGNAIEAATTPNMDTLAKQYSSRELSAHGTAVGLSEGLMGNSEVGHLNIGAGRIVWQDIVRIDVSIKKKEFHKNPVILQSLNHAKNGNGRLHLLGLISDGGVHSHINHLYALLETAKAQGVRETYVHFFGDGRDTAPRSAAGYCQDVVGFMEKEGYGELATVVGRYYAMDRDKRWERVRVAVDGLVRGVGEGLEGKGVGEVIKGNYEKDVTDEFLKPIIVNGDKGRIKDGDTLFLFNYRSDRMREISTILGSLDPSLSIPRAFPNEHRYLIPSPKIPTYDQEPRMSVGLVADKVAELIHESESEFIMCNFAPPDMVGHTGVFDAAVDAVSGTDEAVGVVWRACREKGYVLVVTADHGNAEQMRDLDGGGGAVYCRWGEGVRLREDGDGEEGALCDVAPTVLDLLGLVQPEEMTGKSLLLHE
ncbi:hypothetical protein DFJ43DRAFT_1135046 [Lentinula guzmanii]|uniref:phosphoglycerate mutase (2,3-diphosphoglycerate-independent) n=1 Tax=Lentinula guzmanii TaxID=2804957 RepID=A0AA38J290_9AGAR|nr:hypothetical protein DFJ43DRAFT_1135046 [Lentinula guzmanii]